MRKADATNVVSPPTWLGRAIQDHVGNRMHAFVALRTRFCPQRAGEHFAGIKDNVCHAFHQRAIAIANPASVVAIAPITARTFQPPRTVATFSCKAFKL